MPQCKMAYCREPALPTGKRYCAHHRAEYDRKKREYEKVAATLRCCETCGDRLSKTGHDRGDVYCMTCQQQEAAQRAVDQKHFLFRTAETVEDLKAWMQEYLL